MTAIRTSPSGPLLSVGIAPLSAAFWVDSGTTETARDGSISAPYLSLQEAFDAVSGGMSVFTLLLAKGSTDMNFTIPPNYGGNVSVIGVSGIAAFGSSQCYLGTLTIGNDSQVTLTGLVISNLISTGSQGNLQGCYVTTDLDTGGGTFYLTDCFFGGGTVTLSGISYLKNVQFTDVATVSFGSDLVLDFVSERRLFESGSHVSGVAPYRSFDDSPQARLATDADFAGAWNGNRLVYQSGILSVARTCTLSPGGTFQCAIIDVWAPGAVLDIIDGVTAGTLYSVPSNEAARLVFLNDLTEAVPQFRPIAKYLYT